MTTEQVEQKVRETLHAVALDRVQAPGDLVEKVVRRRGRRRFSQAAGAAVAVVAISVGAVFGFGGGGTEPDGDRPVRPASSPDGWKPWQVNDPDTAGNGCLVDGDALYCQGHKNDAVKFDARTGEQLWKRKATGEGGVQVGRPVGVRDGVVYVYRDHSERQENGDQFSTTELAALDADTGQVMWAEKLAQSDRSEQAAMLIDGAVLANTRNFRTVEAFDPQTGKAKWRYTWAKGTACDRAALGGVPYLLCRQDSANPGDTELIRLDPATGNAQKVSTISGEQGLMGTWGDSLVTVSTDAKSRKNPDDDTAVRNLTVSTITGSGEQTTHSVRLDGRQSYFGLVGDLLIAVSLKGEATAVSLPTGEVLWTSPTGIELPKDDGRTALVAPPVVSDSQGVVYVFSPTGDLVGLSKHTGERVWSDHVDIQPSKGFGFGPAPQLLRYEDVLIAHADGQLVSLLPRIGD
ncbi:outer membrane protein assembly factor BamB family protein [Streptomyces apocyni]|uniref:outer membrane protein assembly factor BamB family protein n=1 Tax=Streptomyces apocyni TaxID=2654677 RepID=UPI0012E9A92E|nr:PQQ-binding-like beta-propeller repeat protein [Streptomyces apocyni]